MSKTSPLIALIAASAFAALAALPGHAAVSKAGRQANAAAAKHNDTQKIAKGKRGDKEAQRRIVTYNLFQDPVFKLNGALADKRQLGAPPSHDRHAQLGNALRPVPNPALAGPLKLQEPAATGGIDFGCSDKPFRAPANSREVTACYKHNVDRSWKTQTYLSREYSSEGSQKWGGGLAVRYAY